MSGDTTYQALKRLTYLPERDDSDNGNVIAGQEYYDVWFTGGSIYNVTLTDVTINGISTIRNDRIITTPGDVTATLADYVITIDKTLPEATTVFLPTDMESGKTIIVKDGAGDAGTYNITIDGDGFDIDGDPAYAIMAGYGAVELIFNGSEWNILNSYKDVSASVVGPGSATADAIALWDGTSGGSLKNSLITVDSSGNLSTPGTITGAWNGASIAVAYGGTGANNAADARSNLGLTIGANVQAYDAALQSIAGLATAADQMLYTTGSDSYSTTSLTSFSRTLLDDTTASAARTTLGLGTAATQNTGTSGANVPLLNGNNTFSGDFIVSNTSPFVQLNETDGTSGYNTTRLIQTVDRFEIHARNNSGAFISTDYAINRGGTGATSHEFRTNGSTRVTIDDSGLNTDAINERTSAAGVTIDGVLIKDGGITISSGPISAGSYTPTLTNVLNVAASGAFLCHWTRIGNKVTVTGRLTIDPTAAGNARVGMSLPVAAVFTQTTDLAGIFHAVSVQQGGGVYPDLVNNRATFEMNAVDTSNIDYKFTFTYTI